MPSRERLRELFEDLKNSHAEHTRAYQTARSKLRINQKAHDATRNEREALFTKLNFFYESILAPLVKPFLANDPVAIDEVP